FAARGFHRWKPSQRCAERRRMATRCARDQVDAARDRTRRRTPVSRRPAVWALSRCNASRGDDTERRGSEYRVNTRLVATQTPVPAMAAMDRRRVRERGIPADDRRRELPCQPERERRPGCKARGSGKRRQAEEGGVVEELGT